MKKILNFINVFAACVMFVGAAVSATRDAGATKSRASVPATRKGGTDVSRNATNVRGATIRPRAATVSARSVSPTIRVSPPQTTSRASVGIAARAATNRGIRAVVASRGNANTVKTSNARAASGVVVRATDDAAVSASVATSKTNDTTKMTETRTGAEYEKCKSAYFECMDQFCKLKNDDYRRCSCSDRVYDLDEVRDSLEDAGQQLTVFTENLEVVGMTAEQATAMRTASEGENALTDDKSASKALLQAIMNSIRGEDSNVGGKYSGLNSVNLAFDTTNAFGMQDTGQLIATYNGKNLYTAVYPQCRDAVAADCNEASLQRAVTAYLMAVEQDCNTVQTAMSNQKKKVKSAIREGSAMLDLARVENRQNHNSSDITTCINEVEVAILSEEVCGAGYHKCLDNGEFIDVATGAPIAGVERFYELEHLLTFSDAVDAVDQKLSKVSSNRTFVKNFESRVKQFAMPALDKCTEQADTVWAEYLDKAMLSIYYAQKAKVAEIKEGCFGFVSSCYMNGDKSLTAAMQELAADSITILQPDKLTLTSVMCDDYIKSCNLMFDGNIIADYIENQTNTDTLTACRAVAQQCFSTFGGANYENFYYPYSGLFDIGHALDWFTLYEYHDINGIIERRSETPVSECAKQLKAIKACSSEEMLRQAFGGFDVATVSRSGDTYTINHTGEYNRATYPQQYGLVQDSLDEQGEVKKDVNGNVILSDKLAWREHRMTGVATEVYNQVVDILQTQCDNLAGRFVEYKNINTTLYNRNALCKSTFYNDGTFFQSSGGDSQGGLTKDNPATDSIISLYGIIEYEDMCPRDYVLDVDTQSWGICSCWENGARRSKNGRSVKCMAVLPTDTVMKDAECPVSGRTGVATGDTDYWCVSNTVSKDGTVCLPEGGISYGKSGAEIGCQTPGGYPIVGLPSGK